VNCEQRDREQRKEKKEIVRPGFPLRLNIRKSKRLQLRHGRPA